ncbi:MAG: hypothetical protein IPP15_05875 [Saprospiraceae bacterium]|uniref:Uncharacterized protein n=1 Tax=Candidatus Opimibacter skivensis TaxID=2982028 RepID=A0A9D7XS03_9BACT|nr:hypothetical protein [Candidatus Opimibacter skivensis]
MKKIQLLLACLAFFQFISAQNVGIGNPMPAEKLDVNGKTKTTNFQMTNGAANGYILQTDANGNATWVASPFGSLHGGGLIPFSTGVILSGATVVSFAPVLMGFGSHTTEVINGSGESTSPPEAGGFTFTVPFSGTIQNLAISADLLVASVASINVTPLIYNVTVYRAPSTPNNGVSHLSSPYVTSPLTGTLSFGGPTNTLNAGTFYTATNINTGSLAVTAGDRIGVRIRTAQSSDPSAADITQLSFSASLFYSY